MRYTNEDLEQQIAKIRMADVCSYAYVNSWFSNLNREQSLLSLIADALESQFVQTNENSLATLHKHLNALLEKIDFYENPNNKGLIKWMFWQVSPATWEGLKKKATALINKTESLQKILPSLYYQQKNFSAEVKINIRQKN